ncbi:conserved exported hypothetical protein [uncultured Desulfobacterium sp.]|uniref:CBM-cenC domain-containing protein n=1 Tax=uncultured Desulfobacterium sp. TaxID=201089 RepID=A0A445N337_9BACT|nr:conserved exported hypothetical protein [uncultured Desulfobacterium sp.]
MRFINSLVLSLVCLMVIFIVSCSKKTASVNEVKYYPVNSMDGVISKTGVQFDKDISSDGNGSLRITGERPSTIRLYETGDIDIEDCRLLYQAKLRTENIDGQVFIEMWCHFPEKGEFFSRAMQSPLSGTNEWVSQETPFFLKKGENPDNVKINIVVNGKGTVWVDDIHLLKAPL